MGNPIIIGGVESPSTTDGGEPVFIIRAHDVFAPMLVEHWASMVQATIGNRGRNCNKAEGARQIADHMRDWTRRNGNKVPD